MSVFCQLTHALIARLQVADFAENWQVITACLALNEQNADGLSWLKGQKYFPQYFWQHRDQQTTLIALGAAKWFENVEEANQFSLQYQMHVIGGIEFEGRASFVLPRLLFVKKAGYLTAYCAVNLKQKTETIEFLHELQIPKAIETLNPILQESHSAYDFGRWSASIELAMQHISQQIFDKVVLANATTLTFQQPLSAHDLLAASCENNHGCFHFLWSEKGEESFIGSSPERLYQRLGREFLTEALAGTVAVSEDHAQTEKNAIWLLNDHKNIYENWLVVDDICTHIADCTSDIQVGDAEIKRLRNVQHLRRKIHTRLADKVSDTDCLTRIHPTAAVAGLPREAAKAFIMENEGFKRGWYAGTLGYLYPDQSEFCVTLRSALVKQQQITLYAGAGIVAESEPLTEWQEIQRKAVAMLNLLVK